MVCVTQSCFFKVSCHAQLPPDLGLYPISSLDIRGLKDAGEGRKWPAAIFVMQQIISHKVKLISTKGLGGVAVCKQRLI